MTEIRQVEGTEKFQLLVSLLEDSEFLKLYVRHVMRGCKKRLVNRAVKEFPVVLADVMFNDWTVTEEGK